MDRPLLVTIATQRSGTKFLGAALNAGRRVRSFGEAFKPPPPPTPFPGFAAGWIAGHPDFAFRGVEIAAMLDAFLDSLAARAAEEGRIAHLDIMYNTLGAFSGIWSWPVREAGESALCRVLSARGAAVIHLVRESAAQCVASRLIAEHRGYHRLAPLTEAERELRLTADLAAAGREMRAILDARDFVRQAFRRHGAYVEIAYPDFIAGDALAAGLPARLAALLGLAETEAAGLAGRSRLLPSAPDKAAVIVNWEALQALEARLRAERGEPRRPA
ncbi:hypothetical protein GXW74_09950 [Roseomonas eburnea]|uniref:Sulphotransferase Stf0 domain-containing protein n=1 Tax=Neoroseomonas eburnea TaxID=1346889 RepID=A0A9X9XAS4_9PROT|nr:hypothetical protein [Neoroseomonas eburnea]MBR0680810.1 hypothetical protein [Neoroseomonas eburnea]